MTASGAERKDDRGLKGGRVDLRGLFESGVVAAAVVGGSMATFVPRPEVCIPGAVTAMLVAGWVLTRWDIRKP